MRFHVLCEMSRQNQLQVAQHVTLQIASEDVLSANY